MEPKEFLEQKLKNLKRKFEKNKEMAKVIMTQKAIVDGKLQSLVSSGTVICAKIAAIQEMLNEEDL